MADSTACWLCNGTNLGACPVCSAPAESVHHQAGAEEPRGRRAQTATLSIHGPDGWCAPEQAAQERFLKTIPAPESAASYNLGLLCEAEEHLQCGDWRRAEELSNRSCKNLERTFDTPFGQGGAQELLCLAFAHRARCFLLKQDYVQVIDDCKRFGRLYEAVIDGGFPDALRRHEQKVLLGQGRAAEAPEASFVGRMTILGAAAEIAQQSRERVGHGWAPKMVMSHTQKAIAGLEPFDVAVFPGVNALRAHLHVTRAQAALELGMWEDAKKDAESALLCDPTFTEAKYMKTSAEAEEW